MAGLIDGCPYELPYGQPLESDLLTMGYKYGKDASHDTCAA